MNIYLLIYLFIFFQIHLLLAFFVALQINTGQFQ